MLLASAFLGNLQKTELLRLVIHDREEEGETKTKREKKTDGVIKFEKE